MLVPLSPILSGPPAASIDDVVRVMTAIDTALAPTDGLWWFNHLYLQVTLNVRTAMTATAFNDAAFLERLDIVFANMYFDAVAAGEGDAGAAPPAWRPLLAARTAADLHPLQFALAGMNAHINRDLPVALVATCRELGLDLGEGSPEHADFERVDALLAQVERRVKSSYLTGWLAWVDRLVHRFRRIDDVVAMWDVDRARDAAWTNAQALWALGDEPSLAGEYLLALDRMVGFAGRGLLVPADSWLLELGRRLSRRRRWL